MLQLFRAGALAWLRPTGRGNSTCQGPEAGFQDGVSEGQRQIAQGPRGRRENPGFSYSGVGPFEAELGFSCVLPPCRLDILHQVAMWQKNFKRIVSQGGGKELPGEVGDGTQRKAHHWVFSELLGWGVAHGPRGPTSYYYMLPMKVRALGLKVALTIKLAQDDLHIMDSLELPTGDPQYLTELAHYRRWGNSVLLVDLAQAPRVCTCRLCC
uniref:Large ribosomal subunit protein uL4m n=1 Tax=Nomascus leucogenys TaxID=61853 RepID=A0A2I3GTP0_NOMLE